MQLGLRTNPNRTLVTELDRAQRLDFDFVDIELAAPHAALEKVDWKEIRSALDERNQPIICHAPTYIPWVNPSPIVRQAALDELRRSIDAAQILGAPLLHFDFVDWSPWLEDQEGYLLYSQLATILMKHGEERGVAIALGNGMNNFHLLKYTRSIFAKTPGLHFTLNAAYLNVNTRRSLTREFLFALSDRMICVTLSDNDGTANQRLAFGAPASGGIDLRQEVRELKSFGFNGRIVLDIGSDEQLLAHSAERLRALWSSEA